MFCLFIQTWDMGLAISARAWAKRCMFEHNIYLKEVHRVHPVFPSVGENIWTANLFSIFSVTRAMESWINETKVYNYQSNTCSDVCGHYTQVCYWCPYSLLWCWCFHVLYFLGIAQRNTCVVSRLCGQAVTKLAVPSRCAQMVSVPSPVVRVLFLCATMHQRKWNTSTNNTTLSSWLRKLFLFRGVTDKPESPSNIVYDCMSKKCHTFYIWSVQNVNPPTFF